MKGKNGTIKDIYYILETIPRNWHEEKIRNVGFEYNSGWHFSILGIGLMYI